MPRRRLYTRRNETHNVRSGRSNLTPSTGESVFFFFFFNDDADPPRRSASLYGFVQDIYRLSPPPLTGTKGHDRGRVALHLDCIEASQFDNNSWKAIQEDGARLALVRIITTEGRLKRLLGEKWLPKVGSWLKVTLDKDTKPGAPAYVRSPESDNYRKQAISRVIGIEYLDDILPPTSLGAAATPGAAGSATTLRKTRKRLGRVFDLARLPPAPTTTIDTLLAPFGTFTDGTVYDVGQANLCALSASDNRRLFVDIGSPLWVNSRSKPKPFRLNPKANDLVIITHWDYDHFAHYRDEDAFKEINWIAPSQLVGPNVYAFALGMHNNSRLHLVRPGWGGTTKAAVAIHLYESTSSNREDANNTGIVCVANVRKNRVVLTGDSDYHHAPMLAVAPADYVVVPHHGGPLQGKTVPSPKGCATAIVSFGKPNRYGHPDADTIANHIAAGWTIVATGPWNGAPRGNRKI